MLQTATLDREIASLDWSKKMSKSHYNGLFFCCMRIALSPHWMAQHRPFGWRNIGPKSVYRWIRKKSWKTRQRFKFVISRRFQLNWQIFRKSICLVLTKNTCLAISKGNVPESLVEMAPGNISHARWFTTANHILRTYIGTENPKILWLWWNI